MNAAETVATTKEQERNRQVAKVERALDQARDRHDQVAGALAMARREKKTLRIIELESELVEAAAALKIAAQEYERVCGVPAPLSARQSPPKPGTVAALRAANPEFRAIDDEVADCERQMNRLAPQIARIEKALAAQGPLSIPNSPQHPETERYLDSVYPERIALRANNIESVQRTVRNSVQLQTTLADLKQQLEQVTKKRARAMTGRDAMLAEFQAQGRQ